MTGTPRRVAFICGACQHVHDAWAPRCAACKAHGLNPTTPTSEMLPATPAYDPRDDAQPTPIRERPRLMIARPPAPDLSPEELVDMLPANGPIPITDVPEASFVRDLTGLAPLDYVLGGGLVAASVVLLASTRGIGKCLGRGTPVLMFDGRVLPVEQIALGDRLMGPDGTPRHVLGQTAGFGKLYQINPIKGASWICNEAHVLTLVDGLTGTVFDIPLEEWLKKSPCSNVRSHARLFSVGVDRFDERSTTSKLPIDPYFLGVWFGDGTKALIERTAGELLAKVQITKPDPEIRALCEQQAAVWGLRLNVYDRENCSSYTLAADEAPDGDGRWAPNPLLQALRDTVGPDVKVPDYYLRSSREDRLQFLAGWCDTDGSLVNTTFTVTQKREDWARAVWWLARSLGFCATLKTRTSRCLRKDGSRFEGTYWVVHISGHTDQIPTRLPRKQAAARRQRKVATRTGFSVQPLDEGPFYGFSLDADGRFLLGDFTVTHNSSLSLQMLTGLGHRCLYVTGEETREQLAATARRIDALSSRLHVLAERDLPSILAHARMMRAQTIVIDSIQMMARPDVNGRAGSSAQLKECTAQLVHYAKLNNTAVWIIGHVTGDGDIAGPKTIEHAVDVVLELTQGAKFEGNERIVRCLGKNRFGPSNLEGSFELTATGLKAVDADGWDKEL